MQPVEQAPSLAARHLQDSFALGVTSETGLLQQVLVHTPGREVELIAPDSRLELLFDDILFVGHARREHLLLSALFEKVVGRPGAVLQASVLLREAFEQEDARHDFVERMCGMARLSNLQAFEQDLKGLSPDALHHFAFTGELPIPIHVPPLPNLMFTRDLAAVAHDHVILSHPATAARSREGIVINIIFRYHPGFVAARDRLITLPGGVTFEGGDLLVAGPEVALIGHSERTSFSGALAVAEELFRRTPIAHVLMVDLPKRRASMHLDTVFTFASPDECVVFPPLFGRSDTGYVAHFVRGDEPGRFVCQTHAELKPILEELLGRALTYIPCGGDDRLSQEREQWTDGANFFALAPGVVVGYERNRRTFDMMTEHGYHVVSAQGFLSYHAESPYEPGEKLAIKLAGTELSRGRGGPRCLTLPLRRLDT